MGGMGMGGMGMGGMGMMNPMMVRIAFLVQHSLLDLALSSLRSSYSSIHQTN